MEKPNAFSYACDPELAKEYLAKRKPEELEQLMASLEWAKSDKFRWCVATTLYGNYLVHELKPASLHASPCWGELFWGTEEMREKEDPVVFWSFECFAAFVLARWW